MGLRWREDSVLELGCDDEGGPNVGEREDRILKMVYVNYLSCLFKPQ
jgi:hypothetical protein